MTLVDGLKEYLVRVDDPRIQNKCSHKLIDILVITVLGFLSQAESIVEIETWAKSKVNWLRQFLELPNGIPSHDTIARVLAIIDPKEFETAFMLWVSNFRDEVKEETLCLDGKVSGGTVVSVGPGKNMLSTVSVYSADTGLVLAQEKASCGIGETGAAKRLLDHFDIKGCTILADAAFSGKSFVNEVVSKGAYYLFPVKGNRKPLRNEIEALFDRIAEKNSKNSKVETGSSKERSHGRKDERHLSVMKRDSFGDIELFKNKDHEHIKAIGRIIYFREEKENRPMIQEKDEFGEIKYKKVTSKTRTKKEVRYFFSNIETSPADYMDLIRKEWKIENQLHWVLDVAFGEDRNQTRSKLIAQNLAVARKIAFNLVKQDKTKKIGVKAKLKLAGWDLNYLKSILTQKKL